ncbi:proton-coupled amino acid transporter-like protein pathetic isoform X2 [Planococcus citri]
MKIVLLSYLRDFVTCNRDESSPKKYEVTTPTSPTEKPQPDPVKTEKTDINLESNGGDEFDPHDYGNSKHPTTFWGNVIHLIVIAAGPTLLSLPSTFVQVGYVIGFFGTFITVLFYMYCMKTIVKTEYILCKRLKRPNLSYPETVYQAFHTGPKYARWFADYTHLLIYGAFMCVWVGGNSIFLLLACSNMKFVYEYFFHEEITTRMIMIYLAIPLVLLCWIPNLKYLVPCSVFTNCINAIGICAILYDTLQNTPSLESRKSFGTVESIPLFLGTILFTLNATGIMMPLKNEMQNPKKFNAALGVLTVSYIPVSILYTIFGTLCYIKYGAGVNENVILNLPPTKLSKIIIGVYGIGICFFYPVVAYVSFEIIWNNTLKNKFQKSTRRKIYEYVVRTLIALSSIVLAYIVPNMALFISLAGTVSTSLDSIIFPAFTQILVHHGEKRPALVIKNTLIILFAFLLMITGTINSISQIIAYYS